MGSEGSGLHSPVLLAGHVTSDGPLISPTAFLNWKSAEETDRTHFYPKPFYNHVPLTLCPHESHMRAGVFPKAPWSLVTPRVRIKLRPFLFPDVAFRCGLIQGTGQCPMVLGLLVLEPQAAWACQPSSCPERRHSAEKSLSAAGVEVSPGPGPGQPAQMGEAARLRQMCGPPAEQLAAHHARSRSPPHAPGPRSPPPRGLVAPSVNRNQKRADRVEPRSGGVPRS